MKICCLIRDIMPEYIEGLCNDESIKMIKEHIDECEECKTYFEDMSSSMQIPPVVMPEELEPFKKIKKYTKQKSRISAIAAVFCTILVIFGISIMIIVSKKNEKYEMNDNVITAAIEIDNDLFENRMIKIFDSKDLEYLGEALAYLKNNNKVYKKNSITAHVNVYLFTSDGTTIANSFLVYSSDEQLFPLRKFFERESILQQTSLRKLKKEDVYSILLKYNNCSVVLDEKNSDEFLQHISAVNIISITEQEMDSYLCEFEILKTDKSVLNIKISEKSIVVNDSAISYVIEDQDCIGYIYTLIK